MAKPFDYINEMVGKDVVIGIKGNREIKAKLVAYDIHLNLSLLKVNMKLENGQEINAEKMFLRGDSIVYIYSL
ncbi:MAG: LSM domain-containing protein [Candidatus Anstonellales archaeon]